MEWGSIGSAVAPFLCFVSIDPLFASHSGAKVDASLAKLQKGTVSNQCGVEIALQPYLSRVAT
jgi:hypothetical protein